MTRRGLFAGIVLVAACRDPLDVGGLALVGPSDGGEGEPPPGDVLEVRVVDDRPFLGTGAPLAGVQVVVVDATGRHDATTDAEGRAQVTGLDLATEPPDVTFVATGYAWLTVVDLGSTGSIPRPLEVGLGALDFCPTCRLTAVTGAWGPRAPGTTIVASLPGGAGTSGSEHYLAYRAPGSSGSTEVVGVVVDDDGGHVVGFDRQPCAPDQCTEDNPHGPELTTTDPFTVGTVTVSLESGLPADHVLAGARASVLVVDENEQGQHAAALGAPTQAELGETLTLEYADEAQGTVGLWAEVAADDGRVVSTSRLPLDSVSNEALRLHEPPRIVHEGDLVLPRDTIQLEGARWAQARAVTLTDTRRILWILLLPADTTTVRLPFAPSQPVVAAAAAAAWDEEEGDPWNGFRLLQRAWSGPHLRATAFDANAFADVE